MPRFSIRRKKTQPEPQAEPEEKIDDQEVSYESESEASQHSEPLSEQMETLKVTQTAQTYPKPETRPQEPPPRRTRDATLARYPPRNVRFANQNPMPRRNAVAGYRNPRSLEVPRPSRSSNGSRKLQYRSIYGANSRVMDSQTKARLLYFNAFG